MKIKKIKRFLAIVITAMIVDISIGLGILLYLYSDKHLCNVAQEAYCNKDYEGCLFILTNKTSDVCQKESFTRGLMLCCYQSLAQQAYEKRDYIRSIDLLKKIPSDFWDYDSVASLSQKAQWIIDEPIRMAELEDKRVAKQIRIAKIEQGRIERLKQYTAYKQEQNNGKIKITKSYCSTKPTSNPVIPIKPVLSSEICYNDKVELNPNPKPNPESAIANAVSRYREIQNNEMNEAKQSLSVRYQFDPPRKFGRG